MASKATNNRNELWKEAKKMRGKNNCLPELVDNTSGEDKIAGLFGQKFYGIFNSVRYSQDELDNIKQEVDKLIQEKKPIA